jgi:hypothetical protein
MAKAITVTLNDGSLYIVRTLLGEGDSNAKLTKSDNANKGYLTVGLSLAPANESGYQVCSSSSPGCRQACLFTAGHGQMNSVRKGRTAKTIALFEERDTFMDMLYRELVTARNRANKQGKLLACRLNVLSDIMWEKVFPNLFEDFKDVQFYDYTKHIRRAILYGMEKEGIWGKGNFPANYHLTFSRSEKNDKDVNWLINNNCPVNIAIVFDSKALPETWRGRRVINGDETDLRFLDESGTVVGLYAKGKAKKDSSGFVIQTSLNLINR